MNKCVETARKISMTQRNRQKNTVFGEQEVKVSSPVDYTLRQQRFALRRITKIDEMKISVETSQAVTPRRLSPGSSAHQLRRKQEPLESLTPKVKIESEKNPSVSPSRQSSNQRKSYTMYAAKMKLSNSQPRVTKQSTSSQSQLPPICAVYREVKLGK